MLRQHRAHSRMRLLLLGLLAVLIHDIDSHRDNEEGPLFPSIFTFAQAKVALGSVSAGGSAAAPSSSNFQFVSKFCFGQGKGTLNWTLECGNDDQQLTLLFFDDQEDSWPRVVSGDLKDASCAQKSAAAKASRHERCNMTHHQVFSDIVRPHYWYFVIANCNSANVLDFSYNFEIVNAVGQDNVTIPPEDWDYQLSYDVQDVPQLYIAWFAILSVLLVLPHCVSIYIAVRREQYHSLMRMLSIIILVQWLSLLFVIVHYAVYKGDGIGVPGLLGFGEFLDFSAQMLFMIILILIAKGWAVSTSMLTQKKVIFAILGSFTVMYLAMWIWQYAGANPARDTYIYDSPAGWIIAFLRVPTGLYFAYCAYRSFYAEPDPRKQSFFMVFAASFSVWFLVLPFIVIIASSLAAWTRFRVVQGIYVSSNLIALMVLVALFLPPVSKKFFALSEKDLLLSTAPVIRSRPKVGDDTESISDVGAAVPYERLE